MPDHLHLLVEGTRDDADLRSFVRDAKQRSGFAYARLAGTRLWQSGYYDHVLRDDDASLNVMRYILENPVRAGLVVEVQDYPYSGSGLYSMKDLLATWDAQG